MAPRHGRDKDGETGDKKRQRLDLTHKAVVRDQQVSRDPRPESDEVEEITRPHNGLNSLQVHVHDSSVTCFCPAGTVRLSKDIRAREVNVNGPHWIHLPCQPRRDEFPKDHLGQLSLGQVARLFGGSGIKSLADKSTSKDPNIVTSTKKRGAKAKAKSTPADKTTPNPTNPAAKFQALQPVTGVQLWPGILSKRLEEHKFSFHCDGPCSGSEDLDDYMVCKQCFSMQHVPCMLYGEQSDRGGPVCNKCYMEFMFRREEILEWQRQRLMLTVQEASKYLLDPKMMGQKALRDWMMQMMADICKNFPRSIQIASEIASEFKAGQALLNMQRDVRGNVARYGPGPSSQPGPVLPTTSQNSDTAAFLGAVNKVIFDQRQGGAARIGPALGNQGRMTAPSSTTSVVPAYPSNYLRPSQQQQAARDITDVHTHGKGRVQLIRGVNAGPPGQIALPHMVLRQDRPPLPHAHPPFPMHQARPQTNNPQGMVQLACKCDGGPFADMIDCFICSACGLGQHNECAINSRPQFASATPMVCNFCWHNPLTTATGAPAPVGLVNPPEPTPLQEEVHNICASILWRHYWTMHRNRTPAIFTTNVPPPPPDDWVVQAQQRLSRMLQEADRGQLNRLVAPVLAAWPRESARVVAALRELALWMVEHGAYRNRRHELGCLAEILEIQ